MDYVLYALPSNGKNYGELILCEVWRELPPSYTFVEVPAANKATALAVQEEDVYIWAPPSTVAELEQKPLLLALGHRHEGKTHFYAVYPAAKDSTQAQVIALAKAFNETQVTKMKKKAPQSASPK